MIRLQTSMLRRSKGMRVVALSLGIGLIGALPLLAYVAFGPKDGNPMGLGLLAAVAVPIATIGVFAGLVTHLVEALLRRRH